MSKNLEEKIVYIGYITCNEIKLRVCAHRLTLLLPICCFTRCQSLGNVLFFYRNHFKRSHEIIGFHPRTFVGMTVQDRNFVLESKHCIRPQVNTGCGRKYTEDVLHVRGFIYSFHFLFCIACRFTEKL